MNYVNQVVAARANCGRRIEAVRYYLTSEEYHRLLRQASCAAHWGEAAAAAEQAEALAAAAKRRAAG